MDIAQFWMKLIYICYQIKIEKKQKLGVIQQILNAFFVGDDCAYKVDSRGVYLIKGGVGEFCFRVIKISICKY